MKPAKHPQRRYRALLSLTGGIGLCFLVACSSDTQRRERYESRKSMAFAPPTGHKSSAPQDRKDLHLNYATFDGDKGLDEYLRYGLSHNEGLKADYAAWQATTWGRPQVDALPDPQVSFTYFVEPIQTRTGPQNARVQLSQRLPWFGKLSSRGALADARADVAWQGLVAKRVELARAITKSYNAYAYQFQTIGITENMVDLLKQLEPIIQTRIQAGQLQNDLLALQVEIGKLENEVASQKARLVSLKAKLRALLNAPTTVDLAPPKEIPLLTEALQRESILRYLSTHNKDLALIRQGIDRENARLAAARSEGRPDVTIGASYMFTGESEVTNPPSDSGTDPFGVTLGFSIPIGREKYRAAEEQALAQKRAAGHKLRDRTRQLESDMEEHFFAFEDAQRQLALLQNTLIPRTHQSLTNTRTAYQTGSTGIIDIIDRERTLLSFLRGSLRSTLNMANAQADLQALCGGELP